MTYREIFNTVTDLEVRDKLIHNTDNRRLEADFEGRSLRSAIGGAFAWRATPEGQGYWKDKYNNTEQLTVDRTLKVIEKNYDI